MPTKRRGPFRTVGMRMQDFGRSLMRHYVPPQSAPLGRSLTPPPAWQADAQTPLIWNEPQEITPSAENLPVEIPPVEMPSAEAPPVRRTRPAAQPVQRKADTEEKIDPRLMAILAAHQERETHAAQIREERHAAAASEIQRQTDESAPDAPPISRRRSRASFDYVETKALMPPDEEIARTTPPKTPIEPIQPARQPDQPGDDDDTEESTAAGTFLPEMAGSQSPPTILERQSAETVDLPSSPISSVPSAPQPAVQRTSQVATSPSSPAPQAPSPSSGKIESSYTAPVEPDSVLPDSTAYESTAVSETSVQPTSEPVQPTIQRKPEAAPPANTGFVPPPEAVSESRDEIGLSPTVQRQPEQAADSIRSEPAQPAEHPTVQRQPEPAGLSSDSDQIPVEAEPEKPAFPAPVPTPDKPSGLVAAQPESRMDTPAERPIVQRQIETPTWTDIEPEQVLIEGTSQPISPQAEPAPTAPERPIIQRQTEALSVPPQPTVQQIEPAAGMSQTPPSTPERPTVQRQAEPAELLSDANQTPVETAPEKPAFSAPVSVPHEPPHQIPAQTQSLSDATAERPAEAPPSMPSHETVGSTDMEHVSLQTEQVPTAPERPIQRQIEQPLPSAPPTAEPMQIEAASTDFPAEIETVQPAPAEPPLAQREISQPPVHQDMEQGEIEERETVSDLPVSGLMDVPATVAESSADSPAQPPAENRLTIKTADAPIQRTPEPTAASETFSAVPTAETEQNDELRPDVFEALVAAGMVSMPGSPNEIRRKAAAPENRAASSAPLPSESDEAFTPEIESEQPLDVFEAMVEAGMLPPAAQSRPRRTEIARQIAAAEQMPRPTPAREQPASQSSFPDRLPVHYSGEPQVVMRVETDDNAPSPDGGGAVDVDKLARDVYRTLRQRLRVEKERRG